jgi:hypothetical protein
VPAGTGKLRDQLPGHVQRDTGAAYRLTCRCVLGLDQAQQEMPSIVDWTDEFDRWLDHAEKQGGRLLTVAVALLQALTDSRRSQPRNPRRSSKSSRRAGTNSGESHIRLIPRLPSASFAGSPPTTKS